MRVRGAVTALVILLGSCAHPSSPPQNLAQGRAVAPAVCKPATALQAGVTAGPAMAALSIEPQRAAAALTAFQTSCAALVRRPDPSGLSNSADWQPVCDAAVKTPSGSARDFFTTWFDSVRIGDGKAFATGYYEPEIAGSLRPEPGYAPIYARPDDLIDADPGSFGDQSGKRVRGRMEGTVLAPYYDRAAIEQGALAGRGLELAWAADPVELFFLQVQGSGRLRLPDGTVIRLGYAGQNGQDYTGIGKLLLERGQLQPGQATMQGIVQWLHTHPDQGQALMRENKSYVFFRRLTGPGPIGSLGVPVVGGVSAAADPRFVPSGAPVLLSLDRSEASGLWVVQDTGGAIKGANRFDTFWGAGDRAQTIAGGMASRGTALLLLPRVTVARLLGAGRAGCTG